MHRKLLIRNAKVTKQGSREDSRQPEVGIKFYRDESRRPPGRSPRRIGFCIYFLQPDWAINLIRIKYLMNAAVSFGSNVDFKHIHWIYLCISDEQTTGSDKYEPEIDNMVSYHNASTETLYKQMVSENLAEFDSRLVWRESAVNHSGQKRSVTGTCRRIKSKKSLIYLTLIISYTFEPA